MNKILQDGSILKALIEFCHKEGENYLISDTQVDGNKPSNERPWCAIYFTSAGIYLEDEGVTGFYKKVLLKNRFEFFGCKVEKASKHIYLRDLTKSWYKNGINGKINSRDKLTEFLAEETRGYNVVCVGASMGGYAALYFGNRLRAKECFVFSPQLTMDDYPEFECENITEAFKTNDITKVYAFFPGECKDDTKHLELAKSINNFKMIIGKTDKHGISFPRDIVYKLINVPQDKLGEVYDGSWVLSPSEKVKDIYAPPQQKDEKLPFLLRLEYKLYKHCRKALKKNGLERLCE